MLAFLRHPINPYIYIYFFFCIYTQLKYNALPELSLKTTLTQYFISPYLVSKEHLSFYHLPSIIHWVLVSKCQFIKYIKAVSCFFLIRQTSHHCTWFCKIFFSCHIVTFNYNYLILKYLKESQSQMVRAAPMLLKCMIRQMGSCSAVSNTESSSTRPYPDTSVETWKEHLSAICSPCSFRPRVSAEIIRFAKQYHLWWWVLKYGTLSRDNWIMTSNNISLGHYTTIR